ncbi:MAG: LysM peptidoglycan-binding domain-containing protein [Siphonobacter sp.]
MQYRNLTCSIFLFFITLVVSARPVPFDSIGIERKGGKSYLLHKVTSGQTLYNLLRKYHVSLEEFKEANPNSPELLRLNEVLRFPRLSNEPIVQQPISTKNQAQIHTVTSGETLFSIARKYDKGTAVLKQWNNLSNDGYVKAGQILYVSDPKEQAPVTSKSAAKPELLAKAEESKKSIVSEPAKPKVEYEPKHEEPRKEEVRKIEEPKKQEEARKAEDEPKPVLAKKPEAEPLPHAVRTENEAIPNAGGKKITEMGICELIDTQDRTGKFLALHRTAPVGTMLTVRNEANNQSVIVKVIGKLPATGSADQVVVRLSAKAFERLQPTDRRIRAEVSYLALEQ